MQRNRGNGREIERLRGSYYAQRCKTQEGESDENRRKRTNVSYVNRTIPKVEID